MLRNQETSLRQAQGPGWLKIQQGFDSSERLTRTDPQYSTDSFYKLKTNYLHQWLEQNNPTHPKVAIWGAGRVSRKRLTLLQAMGIEVEFFIDLKANEKKNTIVYREIPPPGKHFILNYVGNREARDKIHDFLIQRGYQEGRDFISVA